MSPADRRKEVIETCLETFMKNGVAQTSVRDLANALNLNSGGIYWYFKDKEEAVLACAEEARAKIGRVLFRQAVKDVRDPELLFKNLYSGADEMKSFFRFFASVCILPEYEELFRPTVERMGERYKEYVSEIAMILNTTSEIVAPLFYTVVNAMSSYMLFGQKGFSDPHIEKVKREIYKLLEKKE